MNLTNVSDEQLIAKERECTFEIICHFAELDRRRLYAEFGYSSLFDYARRALGYSRTRCKCEVHLEADHIIPWAKGGKTAADNLRILCRTHNLMFARKSFGEEFMKRWM